MKITWKNIRGPWVSASVSPQSSEEGLQQEQDFKGSEGKMNSPLCTFLLQVLYFTLCAIKFPAHKYIQGNSFW